MRSIPLFVNLKPRVYVRPCTKYPTHGIKACVAKQGYTVEHGSDEIHAFDFIWFNIKLSQGISEQKSAIGKIMNHSLIFSNRRVPIEMFSMLVGLKNVNLSSKRDCLNKFVFVSIDLRRSLAFSKACLMSASLTT
ncbi:hypothetical protein BpHYR1_013860 [Brachionus plicatilis]|uniref:Uncharacterized protein n=1 Tax=Brachionus plicatilis TaxID=10195 RepID=A0A3M7SAP5_BRAPC|nr:hypothetical protein BpHYR1_013860 [Brachionus plicatilis]